MMRCIVILVLINLLNACSSNKNVRFAHADFGVVDGNHAQLQLDGQNCVIDHTDNSQITYAQEVALTVAGQAYVDGDETIENSMLATSLAIEGYQLAKNQSKCLSAKDWQKLQKQ